MLFQNLQRRIFAQLLPQRKLIDDIAAPKVIEQRRRYPRLENEPAADIYTFYRLRAPCEGDAAFGAAYG
jgi:hypothetical protein